MQASFQIRYICDSLQNTVVVLNMMGWICIFSKGEVVIRCFSLLTEVNLIITVWQLLIQCL